MHGWVHLNSGQLPRHGQQLPRRRRPRQQEGTDALLPAPHPQHGVDGRRGGAAGLHRPGRHQPAHQWVLQLLLLLLANQRAERLKLYTDVMSDNTKHPCNIFLKLLLKLACAKCSSIIIHWCVLIRVWLQPSCARSLDTGSGSKRPSTSRCNVTCSSSCQPSVRATYTERYSFRHDVRWSWAVT